MKRGNLSSHRNKPHSVNGQLSRLTSRWPDFKIKRLWEDEIIWTGPLRGYQRTYEVGIQWNIRTRERPYVFLIDPPLTPRAGSSYESIPHLIYNSVNPQNSGLCLYDPDGREWSDRMLIADTTLPWAAKWLYYYEFWHYDGIWRGGGVGAESIAQARAAIVHSEA